MLVLTTSAQHRMIAGALALTLALALGAGSAFAQEDCVLGIVVAPAQSAASQLKPKADAAPATPAAAAAAPAAPANGYLCLSNSCAKVAMLPMISEADQAAAAEAAAAEAAQMALVNQVATEIAARMTPLTLQATADDGLDILLTPAVDEADPED